MLLALLAAFLLAAAPAYPAEADCAPVVAGDEVAAGCSVPGKAKLATANATGEAAGDAAAPQSEGAKELALAKEYLLQAEASRDDAEQRRNYELAKQHADHAVELMPESADARFVQFGADGRLAQMGGLAVAALNLVRLNKQLDEVLRLDPNHANALAARGGMLMKLPRLLGGDTDEGIEYLERSVQLDQDAIGKRLELAEAYHIVGRDGDAETTAQSALDVAEQQNDPERVATCERFIKELKKACSGCAVAAIGR